MDTNKHQLSSALTAIICLFVVSILAGCKPPATTAAASASSVTVGVATMTPRRINDVLELDGTVAPVQQVNLMARVPGTLEAVKFNDGERVSQGQILFVIEQPPYIEQLNISQAKLDLARTDYQRQSDLFKENANSQVNVETSSSNLKQAQANVHLAQINLEYTVVKAPFDGIISRRQVDRGNYVGASPGGSLLATVVQIAPAYVNASVGERDALRIRKKLAAAGRLPGAEVNLSHTRTYALLQGEDAGKGEFGVLDFIDHQVNAASGTISVRAKFNNADHHLVPGFYVRLGILLGPDRDALVLPVTQIASDQQGEFVYVLDTNQIVRRRNLVTALLSGEDREIISGLNAGERIVISGVGTIVDGQQVLIKPIGAAQ